MKTEHFLLAVVLLLFVSRAGFADRELDSVEILQIFQKLTEQPKKTWIPAGTIEANHEEYRAPKITEYSTIEDKIKKTIQEYQDNPAKPELTSDLQKMKLDAIPFNVRYELCNEYTMTSTVIVKFDGQRSYCEINVKSRTDSVKPDKDLAGNFMTEQFNLEWNGRRIFAWDGEKYTTYDLPVNNAIINAAGGAPNVSNGPFTAGFVPWGYGFYSYESLAAMDSSAVEKDVDGHKEVHLRIRDSGGLEMVFVMDPQKDYALLSCTITGRGNSVILKQYGSYELVSGNWVPRIILLEKYEAGSNRLLARNLWDITSVDGNVPESHSFGVNYEADALVEYFSEITERPAMYRYSETIDTEQLLAERLAFAANEGVQPQNCATAALKYVLPRLGKNVTDEQLAELVGEPDRTTSLYAMKEFARDQGLYCRAVKTDIETLRSLGNCEVILYIPGKKHFVVLAGIDASYIWTIDLASNRFYYRTDVHFFGMDWTEGVALLLSRDVTGGEFADISDSELADIAGAAGYTCTLLLQNAYIVLCPLDEPWCQGYYEKWHKRYGCESAEDGSCTYLWLKRYSRIPCVWDLYEPYICTTTERWTHYYMRACEGD